MSKAAEEKIDHNRLGERRVIKLSLTGDALDRLLGGDTELELDLKQAAMEEFARRNIKAFEKSPMFKQAVSDIESTIEAKLYDRKGSHLNYSLTLKPDVKKAIENTVTEMVKDKIRLLLPTEIDKDIQDQLTKMRNDSAARINTFIEETNTLLDKHYASLEQIVGEVLEEVSDTNIRKKLLMKFVA